MYLKDIAFKKSTKMIALQLILTHTAAILIGYAIRTIQRINELNKQIKQKEDECHSI